MLLIIVGVIAAAFYKTIFLGQPISKVCMVAEWDSLFFAFAKGKLFPMDSTMVLMLVPAYFQKAELWRAGQIPLWNQLNGLGCPMLGDPQSLVLTPLHLLLVLSPTMRAYNLTLVCEALILALSTYALCRTLKLQPLSSLFGSLTLAFCPFLLWYMEILGNGYCLIPFLFTMFARAARLPTLLRCAWAGVACAILVLSSHPEISFFSITFASMFFCLCRVTLCLDDRRGTEEFQSISKDAIWLRCLKSILQLSIAAVVALCLSAPVLVPFAEFLKNSESYKFDLRNPARMPLETLSFNLLQPTFGGASPFFGVVALAALPLCLFAKPKKNLLALTLFALSLLAFGIGAKVWPINLLLLHKPFAYLITNYCFPVLLVLTAVLASIGFERLCHLSRTGWLHRHRVFPAASVVAVCLLGCAFFFIASGMNIQLSTANFDMCLPTASLARRDWLNNMILTAVLIAIVSIRPLWKSRLRALATLNCIAIGFTSQALVAKASMPIQSAFDYPTTDVIQKLKDDRSHRYIATGNHLFRPNTGSVYGLSDLRQVNPIFPARYVKFMDAAGAKIDDFNQVFTNTLSPLLNLASVSSCLTQTPVIGEQQWQQLKRNTTRAQTLSCNGSTQPLPIELAPGLTLTSLSHIDTAGSGVFGEYALTVLPSALNRYTIGFVLLGAKDETLWFGDQTMISSGGTFSYSIPTQGQATPIKLAIHIFDYKAGSFIVPKTLTGSQSVLTFAEINQSSINDGNKSSAWTSAARFSGNIFLYSNQNTLPETFIVHQEHKVSTPEEGLLYLKEPTFDAKKTVVIEGPAAKPATYPASDKETNSDSATINRLSTTHISVTTRSQLPGWLVLTDIFYPGWEATTDSKQVEILRANYAFRAVFLPAGNHTVEFVYKPISAIIGFTLSIICILVLIVGHCIKATRRSSRRST